jgi:hypothetical protein
VTPVPPLLRFSVISRDRGGAFVTLRLEEFFENKAWKSCGILTLEPETYEELLMTLELGARVTGLQIAPPCSLL